MRMDARIHRPKGPLAGFVDCIWSWQNDGGGQPKERVIPSGALAIAIHLGEDRVRISERGDAARFVSHGGSAITGAHSRYFVIQTPPRPSVMGVLFKPGGAFPFLGVEAGDLEDAHVDLEALWGPRARRLRERLLETSDLAARVRLIEAALLEGAVRSLERTPAVALALEAMEQPDFTRVADLRARTGLSAKRLIALFRDEVGIGPKTYWRIRRFQAALRSLERARTPRGAEVAAQLGYFDQAHMIRDFQAFAGLSPQGYLRAGVDRPNHVPHDG
ncbi:DUF6597 domain-containing transcriptional factor [Pendulispora albinea]|uniref:Helix-turn-helix domain-containing protein n=1 Tax=Pendulispora albinea TaxID=2741071 RepID=A0ABZ2M6I1_9BACT